MPRRTYYDHEPAYRQRADAGHTGWSTDPNDGAFVAFDRFLTSPRFPARGIALDLGCGGGEIVSVLGAIGWRVIGTDYSETALGLARRNSEQQNPSIGFFRSDVTRAWPVAPHAFDLLIDNHVLHCLTNSEHRSAFLTNARSALKPGGTFFSANMSAEGHLDRAALGIGIDNINKDRNRIWQPTNVLKQEFASARFEQIHIDLLADSNNPHFGCETVIIAT